MTTFDEREEFEETRYKHDLELRFRIRARRNKHLGLWLATERLGLTGEDATAYAKALVLAAFDHPGDDALLDHVTADLATRSVELGQGELIERLEAFAELARQEVNEA